MANSETRNQCRNIITQIGSHLAATCAIINESAVKPELMDFSSLGVNVETMLGNLLGISSSLKMLAALAWGEPDPGQGADNWSKHAQLPISR